jgi:signal transduction histidine kinase
LEVRDTGIGIDSKHYDLIFDKFFRVKQPKNFPERQGAGLGLSIVKGLVEAMGGTVTVRSEIQQGSIFTVKLPQKPITLKET